MVLVELQLAFSLRPSEWKLLQDPCLPVGSFVFGWLWFLLVRVALVRQSVQASSIAFGAAAYRKFEVEKGL